MFFVTSNSSEDGHTVAYAIDIAKRTTCAGPLDEHAVEFEVATVKEAIPLPIAGGAERGGAATRPDGGRTRQ